MVHGRGLRRWLLVLVVLHRLLVLLVRVLLLLLVVHGHLLLAVGGCHLSPASTDGPTGTGGNKDRQTQGWRGLYYGHDEDLP